MLLTAAVFMGAAGLLFVGAALAGVAEPAEASTVTPEPVLLEGDFEEVGLTVGATEGRGGVSEDFPWDGLQRADGAEACSVEGRACDDTDSADAGFAARRVNESSE